MPGTCDHCNKQACASPGLSKMSPSVILPPGPPNFHIHTRADLGLCVSMSPTTHEAAMYSYSGWPLPKGILPKEERWLKFSPHSAIQATYLGCLSPRGMFQLYTRASCGLMAALSPWHTQSWCGMPHNSPPSTKASLPFSCIDL